ncbi:MAG TPA: IS21-like element helper ATPase IstB [Catalimonadaceae bacterium]|nr:IS21-like element helper ATPase IstB [Catalimonadaceae bacterium]
MKNSSNMTTLEKMRGLMLSGMADHYQSVLSMPAHLQPESPVLLPQLLEAELLYRNHRRTQTAIKNARFRYQASVEEIICSQDRNLSRETLAMLADGSYIDRGENIIISGATGCGKSFLASALGYQACMQGRKVAYFSLPKLLQQLKSDKLDGSFRKETERIEKMNLLILDDWGLTPLDTQSRLALLQIIEDRHNRYATIITSQLPVSSWHSYINENTIADAILDRIIHKANRIELMGESLRKNNTKKQF